jgi:hypothetical protein
MTINELKKLSKGRWDRKMKRKVVIEWRLGLLKLKEIIVTLKINRWLFRRWVRWKYYHPLIAPPNPFLFGRWICSKNIEKTGWA